MKYLWILGCGLVLTACGDENITYQPKEVQKGFFRQEPCELADENIPEMDFCLCEADVKGLEVSQPQVKKALHEAEAGNLCKGEAASAPAEDHIRYNIIHAEAKVTRDDKRYFGVLYTFYRMNAGAAHGGSWLTPVVYDREEKRLLEQKELVPEASRKKVNALIIQKLMLKNKEESQGMLAVDNHILTSFVREEGCEKCVIYPVEDGWEFAFHEYSIGPYAVGIVKVRLSNEDMGR